MKENMYSILKLTKYYNDKHEYISCYVQKLTGLPMSGFVNPRYLRKYKFKSDTCYIIIRDDMPPHYCVAYYPVKGFLQFEDDWKLILFLSLSTSFSKYLLSAVYDKQKLPTMDAVLDFLHDCGERVLRSPKSKKMLPL